jgi:hypothetical protein
VVYFLKPKTDILLTNKTFVFSFLPNIHVMGHILGQFFFHYLPSLEEGKKTLMQVGIFLSSTWLLQNNIKISTSIIEIELLISLKIL